MRQIFTALITGLVSGRGVLPKPAACWWLPKQGPASAVTMLPPHRLVIYFCPAPQQVPTDTARQGLEECFRLPIARLWDTSIMALGQMQTQSGRQPLAGWAWAKQPHIAPKPLSNITHALRRIWLVHPGLKALSGGGHRERQRSQQLKAWQREQ